MPSSVSVQPQEHQDAIMEDAPPSAQVNSQEAEEEAEEEAIRVRILPGSVDNAASFEILDEGHTLGNALRWVIMKNPDVEFCAYTIPHPSEAKMNVRIQTYEGTAVDALQKGLRDLADIADVVSAEYTNKLEAFKSS
ncbi:hypothetical protein jhhlp_004595 [Lomentospora prolificans]|uniref:DNA-directed RNA polymerase RBP11-like dimerisation domain-containing protein n=1 Tax=Lomentospora prolificans TaxID=41688 RepID=A0A2N3NC86_9PEZI|nr:hypothetical protein jhhlp_004595 [Lomentospora prolificans]